MKKWILLFLVFTACKSPAPAFQPQALDSLFSFYRQHDQYFVSVELEKGGDLIYQQTAGYEEEALCRKTGFGRKSETDDGSEGWLRTRVKPHPLWGKSIYGAAFDSNPCC